MRAACPQLSSLPRCPQHKPITVTLCQSSYRPAADIKRFNLRIGRLQSRRSRARSRRCCTLSQASHAFLSCVTESGRHCNGSVCIQVAALLAPDPEPKPLALQVSQSMGCSFVSGLGLGSPVPRFLRWSGRLALHMHEPQVAPSPLSYNMLPAPPW